jgi:hypothetical protein
VGAIKRFIGLVHVPVFVSTFELTKTAAGNQETGIAQSVL